MGFLQKTFLFLPASTPGLRLVEIKISTTALVPYKQEILDQSIPQKVDTWDSAMDLA